MRAEYAAWRGYEEGLAEGLARLVVRDKAGMDPLEEGFNSYVQAYRTLAGVARLEVETLWRAMWTVPPGQVRARFTTVLDELLQSAGAMALTASRHASVQRVADRLFSTSELHRTPSGDVMMMLWRSAWR